LRGAPSFSSIAKAGVKTLIIFRSYGPHALRAFNFFIDKNKKRGTAFCCLRVAPYSCNTTKGPSPPPALTPCAGGSKSIILTFKKEIIRKGCLPLCLSLALGGAQLPALEI